MSEYLKDAFFIGSTLACFLGSQYLLQNTTNKNNTPSCYTPLDQIPAKVQLVKDGYDTGNSKSVKWRKIQLGKLLLLLEENKETIINAMNQDLGRGIESSLRNVAFLQMIIKHLIDNLDDLVKPREKTTVLNPTSVAQVIPEPLGTVLIISPWNYPWMLSIEPIAAAFSAGNTVVFKPSEHSTKCTEVMCELFEKYFTADTLTCIQGGPAEATELLKIPFDLIFYTGSGNVGKIVMRAAAEHLTPVILELGGKSPAFVCDDINLDFVAQMLCNYKISNAGQLCVNVDYAIVPNHLAEELIQKMKAIYEASKFEEKEDYQTIINSFHYDRVMRLIEGEDIVTGGVGDRNTLKIHPTILRNPSLNSPVMSEEIFGPVLPVIFVDSIEEGIKLVNSRDKPLALYIFSEDDKTVESIISSTSSGGVCVNGILDQILEPNLPFGGVGASGMGVYHGEHNFETFSHMKAVLRKPAPQLPTDN